MSSLRCGKVATRPQTHARPGCASPVGSNHGRASENKQPRCSNRGCFRGGGGMSSLRCGKVATRPQTHVRPGCASPVGSNRGRASENKQPRRSNRGCFRGGGGMSSLRCGKVATRPQTHVRPGYASPVGSNQPRSSENKQPRRSNRGCFRGGGGMSSLRCGKVATRPQTHVRPGYASPVGSNQPRSSENKQPRRSNRGCFRGGGGMSSLRCGKVATRPQTHVRPGYASPVGSNQPRSSENKQPRRSNRGCFRGGGGIRTHGTSKGTAVFKTAAFVRSATPPKV